jgi:DNA-binding SARP family transcriptional activator
MVTFGILGPFEVCIDGDRSVALGGRRQRALLAILVLHANEVVSIDSLVDLLWGDRPPATAVHTIRVFVSHLRPLLGSARERLRTRSPGYLLEIGADELDAARCERLYAEARSALLAGQPARARALLREALSLWRGPPLAEFTYEVFAQAAIARLGELRMSCREEMTEAELALGQHADLVAELEALVREEPLRERPRSQLMLALYRCGRQADALDAYRQARRTLVEELGVEPSPTLRELEHAILRHDESLQAPEAAADGPATLGPVLPSATIKQPSTDAALLIGRDEPMARLVALLEGPRDDEQRQLLLVSGEPGVGKTRLLRAFAAWAAAHDYLVPLTSAEDDEILPYRPFSELVRAIVGSRHGNDYLRQLGPLAAELSLLVPELGRSPEPPSTDPALTRTRLFGAVTRLIAMAAAQKPLVILIDDAQAMGRATAALVKALYASCDDRRLAVVLAVRDPPGRELSGLQDVLRQLEAATLRLSGLTDLDLALTDRAPA